MPPGTKACIYQRASNEPAFDLRRELFRIAGVDLTDVPGISTNTAQTILTEVGPNVARFRNASAFASWLGLSPEKQVSGGKTLYTKTRTVKNRAAIALRLGASCLYHAKTYLGEFFRRMKFRLGTPQAITATAHKLARVLYHMLRTKEPYSESVLAKYDELAITRAYARLRRKAAQLGYVLTPQKPIEGGVVL
jgi:transposase